MKTSTKCIIIILAIFFSQTITSQKWMQYGDDAYNNLQFSKAIVYYEKANNKQETKESLLGLAKSYQKIHNAPKAYTYYRIAYDKDLLASEDKVEFAKVLYDTKKHEELLIVTNDLAEKGVESETMNIINQSLKLQDAMKHDSIFFDVKPFLTDGEYSYFSPALYEDGLLIVSDNKMSTGAKDESYKGGYYFDIYYLKGGEQKPLGKAINSRLHEASPVFCDLDNKLYFTKSNVLKRNKIIMDEEGENDFKIYTATLSGDGEWSKPELFPHSDNDYSSGHPALTKDGKKLFFTSDKPSGLGSTDIYFCELKDGEWSEPENLGNIINTPGKEMFPTLRETDSSIFLYFSSDYKIGMGGLDIYVSENSGDGWSIPNHMTYPINTKADDFGLVWKDSMSGYLSSNRNNENLVDGIHEFNRVTQKFYLAGYVTDGDTKKPINLAEITLDDSFYDRKSSLSTNEDGYYFTEINPNSEYFVWATKEKYPSKMDSLTTIGLTRSDTIFVNFELFRIPEFYVKGLVKDKATNEPIGEGSIAFHNKKSEDEEIVSVNEDGTFFRQIDINSSYELAAIVPDYFVRRAEVTTVGLTKSDTLYVEFLLEKLEIDKPIRLENIYYDFDKWNIREDAKAPLEDLVKTMKKNPTIVIELSSHTDSRGSDRYNQKLSQRRAKSAIDYIATRGIDKNRLKSKGYGESQLLNRCKNGVKCSKEEHQLNRRTEFKVLSK